MSSESVRVNVEDVQRDGRMELEVGGRTVVVFAVEDRFVAYVDSCAHLGGPVCSQGSRHPFYTARVEEDGRVEPYFAPGGEMVIACPWHGWEYDLNNGVSLADGTKSLQAAKVTHDRDELVVSL